MEGQEFFAPPTLVELEERLHSSDAAVRWAAVIELGEMGDEHAAVLVRRAMTDPDEYTAAAARTAIRKFGEAVLLRAGIGLDARTGAPAPLRAAPSRMRSHLDALAYLAWKVRPLPEPAAGNAWLVDAAVIEIVQTEGPVCGHRLARLYGCAVFPNNPGRISRSRLQASVRRLISRGILARHDSFVSDKLDDWVIAGADSPGVVVRQRGPRDLEDIPVNEVAEALRSMARRSARGVDRDEAFRLIMEFYGIQQRDFHLVGGLLTDRWAALLS